MSEPHAAMTPDALHARWSQMLAQAMRFASVGTYAEATNRAEQLVAEAAERLDTVPKGELHTELESLAAQAQALVTFWRTERLAKRARSLARGSKERARELEPPDYEALMESRAVRRSNRPPAG